MDYKNKGNLRVWHAIFSLLFATIVGLLIYNFHTTGRNLKDIPLFDFFILSLATFRLIRLFTYDEIVDFIRDYLGRHRDGGIRENLYDLMDCPWCTGMWMALLVSALYFFTPLSRFFIFVLALAGAASYLQIIIWKIGKEE